MIKSKLTKLTFQKSNIQKCGWSSIGITSQVEDKGLKNSSLYKYNSGDYSLTQWLFIMREKYTNLTCFRSVSILFCFICLPNHIILVIRPLNIQKKVTIRKRLNVQPLLNNQTFLGLLCSFSHFIIVSFSWAGVKCIFLV